MSITVQRDSLSDDFMPPKRTATLNVLTILTIIGCVILIVMTAWNFATMDKQYADLGKYAEQYEKSPSAAKGFMPKPAEYEEMITITYENRYVLTLLGLISIVLCFMGALQMRKLKKSGYWLWLTGELLPFVYSVVFFGMSYMTGLGTLISLGIAFIFIVLYTFQKKNLVY